MVPAQPVGAHDSITVTISDTEGFADPPLDVDIRVEVDNAVGDITYDFTWQYKQNEGDTYGDLVNYPLLFSGNILDDTVGPTSDDDITVSYSFDIPGWYEVDIDVTDDTGVISSLDNEIRVLGIIPEDIAYDVKGAIQKICVKGLLDQDPPSGIYDIEWSLEAGVNLTPDDISAGPAGGNLGDWDSTLVSGEPCIEIKSMEKGDIHIYATVGNDPLGGDDPGKGYLDVVLHTEKKWGELDHSILDLDADEPGIQGPSEYVILTPTPTGEMERTLEDTIYATFYETAGTRTVGHAIVHWWLFEDSEETQELIDDLMDHLASQDGALNYNHWAAQGKYDSEVLADMIGTTGHKEPFDVIDYWTRTRHANSDIFWWEDWMDNPWYFQNETTDSWSAEDRGKTQATLVVDTDEVDPSQVQKVIIVALVSYPGSGDSKDDPFNGQNIVAVEKSKISATWGRMDLHPDFVADKTEAEVGEAVTFTNLTFGGRRPYRKAEWDFDGNGESEITIEGSHGEVMASVIWAYDTAGTYCVAQAMTDKIGTTVWKEKPGYIVVRAEQVEIWDCPVGGVTLISPNLGAGRPFLTVAVDPADIIVSAGAELWGIYHLDETTREWLYFIPGFTSTLTQLEPDKFYLVVVSGACMLTIPQGT